MVIADMFPIWALYLIMVVLVLVVAEIGFRIGRWMKRRDPSSGEISGVVVGGLLGLMAFLMAFTIGIVMDQDGSRKAMVVAEANAVGTAWLRTGFLNEPDQTTSRDLLREYVTIRLEVASDPSQLAPYVARSEEIHGDLWSIVEENVRQGNDSDIMGLYVESINEVIDVHLLRMTAATRRLPWLFGIVLFTATLLSFLLIGVANSADGKRDFAAIFLFALAFIAVLMIIVDLDRPQEGLLSVSQTAMSDLLKQMTMSGP